MIQTYNPQGVLQAVDTYTVPVSLFMTLCLSCTFLYLISAFRTARRHKAYPAPLISVGWFAVHDAYYVSQWHKWFIEYDHWWLKTWCIALIFTSAIEFLLCYQVFKYGHEELLPTLKKRTFGFAILGCIISIGVVWSMIKPLLNDDLSLISFAVTAWWPPVCATIMLTTRKSMRGQSMMMNWCLFLNPIGMNCAWLYLDPYFRSPLYLCFVVVTVGWAGFNLIIMRRYPAYTSEVMLQNTSKIAAVAPQFNPT